jgi:hydroxymethylpyrimidine/phosphomethylpyrimidine kinase
MGSPDVLRGDRADRPVALTIAGSDSGGGAGIQADLACFLALGVHGVSALTAVTSQNTHGISGVEEVAAAFVGEQIRHLCADLPIAAAKTGMLASAATIREVAAAVTSCGLQALVVDPVLASTSGTRLLAHDAEAALVAELFPLALMVTPNLDEAAALAGREVSDLGQMREAARILHRRGPDWVLVKGGHLEAKPVDVLYDGTSFLEFDAERVGPAGGPPVHGTGCVLSAAITAHLARGAPVPDAVRMAKDHVTGAIRHARQIGAGVYAEPAWNLYRR